MNSSSMTRLLYQYARFGLAVLMLVGIASSCSRSVQGCWEGERYFDSTGAFSLVIDGCDLQKYMGRTAIT